MKGRGDVRGRGWNGRGCTGEWDRKKGGGG